MPRATAPQISPLEIAQGVVAEIERRREKLYTREDDVYEPNNPIASDIDPDSCMRRQTLKIVKPREAKPMALWVKQLMEAGNVNERAIGIELARMGFEVIHQQARFSLDSRRNGKRCLSGKIDGKLEDVVDFPFEIPFEVKQVSQVEFDKLTDVDALKRHQWYGKYFFQMQSYLIGHGLEVGFFIITDGRGHWRFICIVIDYEIAERIWTFAENVMEAVERFRKDETLPAMTEDTAQCLRCPFFKRACQPEIPNEGVIAYDNGMMLQALERRHELEETAKEYQRLDKKIKKWFDDFENEPRLAGRKLVMVGDFTIEFDEVFRKGYTVGPKTYRKSKIQKIDPAETKVVDLMGALKDSLFDASGTEAELHEREP